MQKRFPWQWLLPARRELLYWWAYIGFNTYLSPPQIPAPHPLHACSPLEFLPTLSASNYTASTSVSLLFKHFLSAVYRISMHCYNDPFFFVKIVYIHEKGCCNQGRQTLSTVSIASGFWDRICMFFSVSVWVQSVIPHTTLDEIFMRRNLPCAARSWALSHGNRPTPDMWQTCVMLSAVETILLHSKTMLLFFKQLILLLKKMKSMGEQINKTSDCIQHRGWYCSSCNADIHSGL